MKLILPLLALTAFAFTSCGGSRTSSLFPAQPLTGAEAPLYKEINQTRTSAGKKVLKQSQRLNALAASEASRLAASGSRTPNVAFLKSRVGFGTLGALVGSLKDRGAQTGASFPSYWVKTETEKGYLLGKWHSIGVGTAKSKAGELVSIVLFQ